MADDWEKTMDEVFFNAESGYAILRAAVLDQLLLKLLLTHMPSMSNTFAEEVFDGPLSTFSAKIDVSRALAEKVVHFKSPHIVKEAKKFKQWKQGANTRKLFDDAVTRAVRAMQTKIDEMIFADATRGLGA